MLDYVLSVTAMGAGYYETNNFTNSVGFLFHMLLLTLFNYAIYSVPNKKMRNGYFYVFNMIWGLNNIYSLWLVI